MKRLGLRNSKTIGKEPAFRLLCNLPSGACNPAPIRKLKSSLNWGSKSNDRLHAKVYVFDDVAILGSANPSANGLALEGSESASWHEVCGLTNDATEIARLAQWFDDLYESKESEAVTNGLLKLADELWKRRRRDSADVKRLSARSLKKLASGPDGSIVRDNTWIWIYDEPDVSEESKSYNSQLRSTHGGLSSIPYEAKSDPRRYQYDKLIDCFYKRGRDGKVRVEPTQYRIYPELSKRIIRGESKGLWTLPNSQMRTSSPGGNLLDSESIRWLRGMVQRKLKDESDWGGTLGELIEETESGR